MAEPLRETPTSPGDAWRPPAEQEQTEGLKLPGYTNFIRIAAGTGSRVYRAWQETLDRPVAVKVLHLDDPEAIARFEREIDITVQLGRRHPNIVTVLDIGSTGDGRPCIVMEYCDGGSLHDRLRTHGPLPPDEVLEAGIVVADALWFAHGQGVLHRDVKPQNVLVLPTSYVLADFGIARRADATQHTASIDWFTFQHASPQVIDGETPTEQDDIWSVGSTLFTLLDGRSPHAGSLPEENKPLAYMRRVRTAAARPLNRTDLPAGLGEIIARCLRPEREERFASAADLRDALLRVQAQMRAWAPGRTPAVGSEGAGSSGAAAMPEGSGRQGTGPRESYGTGPRGTGMREAWPGAPEGTGSREAGPYGTGAQGAQPREAGPYGTGAQGAQPREAGPYGSGARGQGAQGTGAYGGRQGGQGQGGQGVAALAERQQAPQVARGRVAPPAAVPESLTMQRPAAPMTPAELANLVASAASAGYPVVEEKVAEPPPPVDDPPRRSRGPRLVVAAVAALAAGVAAGFVGMSMVKQANNSAQEQPQAQQQSSVAAPQATASPEVNLNNAAIALELTTVRLSGSSVFLRWRDPTQGKASFVVVRVENGEGKPVTAVNAGITETTLEGVEATGQVCYLLIAVMEDKRGFSPTKCSGTTSQ